MNVYASYLKCKIAAAAAAVVVVVDVVVIVVDVVIVSVDVTVVLVTFVKVNEIDYLLIFSAQVVVDVAEVVLMLFHVIYFSEFLLLGLF